MNSLLLAGSVIVTLALIFYSIAIIWEQKIKHITMIIVFFASMGLIFDISATTLMILGSTNSPFTFHGVLGYSALLLMAIDIILMWKLFRKERKAVKIPVPSKFHLYTRYAYIWWVMVYITGAILIALK